MAEQKLDNVLEDVLKAIVSKAGPGGDQLVTMQNADRMAIDELKRRDFLTMADYDLSGNASVMLAYKGRVYFGDAGDAPEASVSSHKVKIFETFGETYTKVRGIGNGGAGNVYEVKSSAGKHYALKLLSAEAARNSSKLKRFLQEARFELSGKCDSVVRAVDLGCIGDGDDKRPFYVMPLMDGSLEGLMKRPEEFSPGHLAHLLMELMDGLKPFYAEGDYHRDVKPQNLLYDASKNRLLLSDLGVAHIEEDFPGATVETVSSDRLANFRYAAPEQREKGGSCDQRTDIYAFGLILNELFTGSVPQGANYKRIASVDPEYAFLDRVVERMISQDPADRYASVGAVLLDIEALSSSADAEAAERRAAAAAVDEDMTAVRIIDKHWEDGAIVFDMSDGFVRQWLDVFKSYGRTSFCTDGFYLDPMHFGYEGSKLTVPKVGYDEDRAKDAVEYVSRVVDWANGEYGRKVRAQRERDYNEELRKRRAELEKARKDAELGGAINDMLAGL